MRSPLVTMVAVVLGWPAAVLILIGAYLWYLEEFHVPDVPPVSRERVQHPAYHPAAKEALARFGALPEAERDALLAGLRATIVPLATWLDGVDRAGFGLICLGEDHEPHSRRFLADRVFPMLRLDALHLEATAADLADVERRLRLGRDYAPLLGTNIAGVLRAARQTDPALAVTAIEETARQRKDRLRRGSGSREESLVANLEAGWLYARIRRRLSPSIADGIVNLRIIGEHQDGPLEAFVYFLDEVELPPGDFVLVNTDAVPATVQNWFPLLWNGPLGKYRAILVFRVESQQDG